MISKFKFWCSKVLPMVYDNSLSYYELLCKVVNKLNETIDAQNDMQHLVDNFIEAVTSDLNDIRTYLDEKLGEQNTKIDNAIAAFQAEIDDFEDDVMGNITALTDAFDSLQDYVDNYFDNLDISSEVQDAFDAYADAHNFSGMIQDVNKPKIIFIGENNDITNIVNSCARSYRQYNFNVGQTGGTKFYSETPNEMYSNNFENVNERTDLSVNTAGWYEADAITHVIVCIPEYVWESEMNDIGAQLHLTLIDTRTHFKNAKVLCVLTSMPTSTGSHANLTQIEEIMRLDARWYRVMCDQSTKAYFAYWGAGTSANEMARYILDDVFLGVPAGYVRGTKRSYSDDGIECTPWFNAAGNCKIEITDIAGSAYNRTVELMNPDNTIKIDGYLNKVSVYAVPTAQTSILPIVYTLTQGSYGTINLDISFLDASQVAPSDNHETNKIVIEIM